MPHSPPLPFPFLPAVRFILGVWCTTCVSLPLVAQEDPPVPVIAVEIRREVVMETLPLTGTVTARQAAALSSRITGLVESVQVDAGSHVNRGDPLLMLDATLAELAAQSAEAASQETATRLAEAERLLEESRRLLAHNSIAETEFMNRQAAVAIATAAARQAEITHREHLKLWSYHTVVAPFDGVITRKFAEAGEWVSTGTPVLQLVGLEGARVDVQVPQERLAAIAPDTAVEFALDTAPDQPIAGRITARVPVSNPNTRTALVRIEPHDRTRRLSPGKSVQVTFRLQSDRPVLTVPRDALVRRADGTVNVWVAEPQGARWRAASRRVDLGRPYAGNVEILAGVQPGQQVIVRGNETVREGQLVQLIASTP